MVREEILSIQKQIMHVTLIYDKSDTAEQERMVLGKLGICMKKKKKKDTRPLLHITCKNQI